MVRVIFKYKHIKYQMLLFLLLLLFKRYVVMVGMKDVN